MSRPGFTFCISPDPELIREHIAQVLAEQGEPWQRKTFWADEELPEAYWDAFTQGSLLEEKTALVLRRAEQLSEKTWSKHRPLLSRFRSQVWPFFCIEKEWAKGKPSVPAGLTKQKFWSLAQKKSWIWRHPGLDNKGQQEYIRRWLEQRGLQIDSRLLARAASLLPLEAAGLKSELAKLELAAREGSKVEPHHLEVISFEKEMDIFGFLQALQDGGDELGLWKKIFQNRFEADGEMFLPFVHLLLREARILWQLAGNGEAQVALPPRIKKAKSSLAGRIGRKRLAAVWPLLLEAEAGVKSGEWAQGQALEMLVTRLRHIFRSEASSRSFGSRAGR